MNKKLMPVAGEEYRIEYPFVYDSTPSGYDADGSPWDEGRWSPGIRALETSGEDVEMCADNVGTQILTVVSVHKPGRYQTRIFYTQRWIDPDGRNFGKGSCRVMTLEKFRRRVARFQVPFVNLSAREAA